MDNIDRNKSAPDEGAALASLRTDEASFPPWLFRHDDFSRMLAEAQVIGKKKLANIINHIHFVGGHILAQLKHPQYEDSVLVKVYPEPCLGDKLNCRWDQTSIDYNLNRYHFLYLLIDHEQSLIVVPARLFVAGSEGFTIQLPEESHAVCNRQPSRFICRDVDAELWQNGFQAAGELMDFSPHTFRIRVQPAPPSSFHWFNSEVQSTIRLSKGSEVFFSGNCNCLYQKQNGRDRELLLAPLQDRIRRFPAKVLRNPRRQPSPPLNAVFEHPFSKKKLQRDIFDISTSGFSICDKSDEVVLMPGMIIPGLNIVYAGILKIECKAQVIYRKEEEEHVRFGLAVLDMGLTAYNHLTQLLNHVPGAESGLSNEIDLDELWKFFFETDFIYPEKYKHIQSLRDNFRDTYRRLYEITPELAKHFIYQKNGRIYGHLSMLRAYERTWMVHHHAAKPMGSVPTGLLVLKQLIFYVNDLHHLPSANLDYIITYYRPGNRFPERIFGSFAQAQANPQRCSLDIFSYLTYPTDKKNAQLPRDWLLRECSSADLWEFEHFYRNRSGGLFWSIMKPESQYDTQSLEEKYAGCGFTRRWKIFSLLYLNDLKAVIIAEESDVGINLSDLLNGFKIFIVDSRTAPNIIFAAVSLLTENRSSGSVPLLIYPDEYVHQEDMPYEKKRYCLWIMDVQYRNEYLQYLEKKFRLRFV